MFHFSNCSRTVFFHQDELGSSKFILYKDNYQYIEKTNYTDFKFWGKYETTDTTIVFDLKDKSKLPYTWQQTYLEKTAININNSYFNIQAMAKETGEPLMFASVQLFDKNDHLITGNSTDLDGKVRFLKNDEISYLEITYLGLLDIKIDYQNFQNNDLKVKIEELPPGGRMGGTCQIVYLDVLLIYKKEKTKDFSYFSRNGFVFKKEPF
jgi:hypothetical protein